MRLLKLRRLRQRRWVLANLHCVGQLSPDPWYRWNFAKMDLVDLLVRPAVTYEPTTHLPEYNARKPGYYKTVRRGLMFVLTNWARRPGPMPRRQWN